jgi:hypothetical protein
MAENVRGRGANRGRWGALGAAVVAGLAVASAMLWIAFQENPQGEFFDPATGAVDWPYSIALFGLWFVVVAAPTLAVGMAGVALHGRLRRRRG